MKIETLLCAVGSMIWGGSVIAGFVEGNTPVSSVADVLKMRDDTPVVLEGQIQKHIKKDKYLFADTTGQITVEIDEKDWDGVDVKPTDMVRLNGEVDRDWHSVEVDVHSVALIP